ncbi:MAG: SirB2 family protein [Alphaproteobacteria bacterium]|nr:SirB2 family protein [Alphaproteobacteria bacterium]
MATLVMNTDREQDRRGDDGRDPGEWQRRRRSRNLAVAGILGALVVLFYIVTIVKMSGG